MKANELRIDNWIESPVIGWAQINTKGIQAIAEGKHKYKPIPLTEEWVLKLGFKRMKRSNVFFCKRVLIYFHLVDNFAYGKSHSRTKLKHVHQLQNLFYCLSGGEELTIK